MDAWQVVLTRKAERQATALPKMVRENLYALLRDIKSNGPTRGDWPNYGKLSKMRHHCHIKTGRPTYVAVWEVANKKIKLVEVIYAGTYEKAPY
jgi:mRNA-degrading endonuclease RelE of RelBE toxin-antitoxin system